MEIRYWPNCTRRTLRDKNQYFRLKDDIAEDNRKYAAGVLVLLGIAFLLKENSKYIISESVMEPAEAGVHITVSLCQLTGSAQEFRGYH